MSVSVKAKQHVAAKSADMIRQNLEELKDDLKKKQESQAKKIQQMEAERNALSIESASASTGDSRSANEHLRQGKPKAGDTPRSVSIGRTRQQKNLKPVLKRQKKGGKKGKIRGGSRKVQLPQAEGSPNTDPEAQLLGTGMKASTFQHAQRRTAQSVFSTQSKMSAFQQGFTKGIDKTGLPIFPNSKHSVFQQGLKKIRKSVSSSHSKQKTKVRGRVADRIRVPWILRFLAHRFTMVHQEWIMCLLVYCYYYLATYAYLFDFGNQMITSFLTAIDYILLLELVARLISSIRKHHLDHDYLTTLAPTTFGFWILLTISLFPIDYILQHFLNDSIEFMHRILLCKFNRLILLYRIYKFCVIMYEEQHWSEQTSFMVRFFMLYVGFVHAIGCLFYYATGATAIDVMMARDSDKVKGSWIAYAYETKVGVLPSPFYNYILSLSFSASMVTTVGYGDLGPRNEYEMLMGVFVMLIGCICLDGLFGSAITGFLLEKDSARYELFHRVELIQKNLMKHSSSALFASKVAEYYECLWNYREGVYKVELNKLLPPSMYDDILFDICAEMFHKTLMFRGMGGPFLRALSHIVEVVIYNPEMIICLQNELPTAMYFIIQGECVVKTPYSANETAAILRPGCMFGECSLFYSFPHVQNIETRTCCQLFVIRKKKLMRVCQEFPTSFSVMRARWMGRMSKLRENYEQKGEYPVLWVSTRESFATRSTASQIFTDYPVTLRWAEGFNPKVPQYIAAGEVSNRTFLVDMSCLDPNISNAYSDGSGTCVIPATLATNLRIVQVWHVFFLVIGLVYVMTLIFVNLVDQAIIQGPVELILKSMYLIDHFFSILCAVDLVVEVFTATESSGMYYRAVDGLRVKLNYAFTSFIFDVIALAPISTFMGITIPGLNIQATLLHIVVGRIVKIVHKLRRYFRYLTEKYPRHVFLLRITETAIDLAIHSHIYACALFFFSCKKPKLTAWAVKQCTEISFFQSYYIPELAADGDVTEEQTPNGIMNYHPYLVSMFFAIATLSSAGFGDFVPQSSFEMLRVALVQLYDFYVIGRLTSKLTSALSCSSLAQIKFEQKLVSMRSFFKHHGLTMRLRDRIIEHYKLQYQYNKGITLPPGVKHLMFDAPPYLAEDALYAELGVHLEGVPIFSQLDVDTIILMAKLVQRYVLPPNIVFVHRGDVRRHLYIVKKGSVAILKEDTNEVKAILEETGHFGLRDLLYGEPSFNNVKTLSYCLLYVIDYASWNIVGATEEDLFYEVERCRGRLEDRIELLTFVYKRAAKIWVTKERKPTEIPSWIVLPTKENEITELCSYDEAMEPFTGPYSSILKRFLMRRTVHPAGSFALFWCLFTAAAGVVCVINVMTELMLEYSSPLIQIVLFLIKLIFILDMYVRMHWGFYTEQNHLIFHPVKTAAHYFFEGPFMYELFLELVEHSLGLYILGALDETLEGEGSKWDAKMQLRLLSHLIRVPIIFQFGHNVTRKRIQILLIIYVAIILSLCSILSSIALYFACPWDTSRPSGVGRASGLVRACLAGTWLNTKESIEPHLDYFWNRWLVGIYYICQTILVIGYGDMVTLKRNEMIFLCVLMLFGLVVTRCIVADFTAYVVSEDQIRGEYGERMIRIKTVMKKQGVDRKLIKIVDDHLEHTWTMSRGLKPKRLLDDLHPALQADLFKEYIGNAVSGVPILNGLNDSFIRTLCTYLNKHYFTCGERIARKGNVELEMYIIEDGDVWITGDQLQYRVTLGPGETFGEAQMMYGLVRSYSAVAANNVVVYALTATDFADILEHYPGVKTDMEERMGMQQMDLFERKIRFVDEQKVLGGRGYFMNVEARITREVRESVSKREVWGAPYEEHEVYSGASKSSCCVRLWCTYVCDSGSRDTNLPFFYFARDNDGPSCGFQELFSSLVTVIALLTSLWGTYFMNFAEYKKSYYEYYPNLEIISFSMEGVYWFHIFLQFVTPFPTVEGRYCKEWKRIFFNYTRSPTHFALDIISSLPLQFFSQFYLWGNDYPWELLNCIRALRLVHYFRSLQETYKSIHVSPFRHNIIASVSAFVIMAHGLAVVFYSVSACQLTSRNPIPSKVCPQGTWTAEFIKEFLDGDNADFYQLKSWKWYVRSTYWVITTISTTGYGDIVAVNLKEVLISVVCIFCGVFILALILSYFTSGITSLNRHRREYLYELMIVTRYLGILGLSKFLQHSLIEWFLNRWETSRGISFSKAISILPLSLKTTVGMALYHSTVSKVPLFSGMELRFFRCLVGFVEHIVFLPGQVVAYEGDRGNTLYIVAKGRVSSYRRNRHDQPYLVRWYDEGSCFGRLPTLFYDESYMKTYRAEVVTEVLTINKHSIFYLARFFRQFQFRLKSYIARTYKVSLGTDNIFSLPHTTSSSIAPSTLEAGVQASSKGTKGVNTRKPRRKARRKRKTKWLRKGHGKDPEVNEPADDAMLDEKTQNLLAAFRKVKNQD